MAMASLTAALFFVLACRADLLPRVRGEALMAAAMGLHVAPWFLAGGEAARTIGAAGPERILATVAGFHWLGWLSTACLSAALLRGRGWLDGGLFGTTCASAGAVLLLEVEAAWHGVCGSVESAHPNAPCAVFGPDIAVSAAAIVAALYCAISIALASPRRAPDLVTFSAYSSVAVYCLA